MDVDAPGFDADFYAFCGVIKGLDRHLGALIMQVRPCSWPRLSLLVCLCTEHHT